MSYIGQVATDTPKEFPESAKGLNWGAFFLYWVWGPVQGHWMPLWIGLGCYVVGMIIPFVPLVPMVYYLIKGNEVAWDVKDWSSVEAFHEYQKKWAMWGCILAACGLALLFLCIMLFMGAIMAAVAGGGGMN